MTTTTDQETLTRSSAAGPPVVRGALVVYRWELVKLAAQAKVQGLLVLCLITPLLFVTVLAVQSSVPTDTLFGRWVHDTGFAIPLVMLGFAAQWALPALSSIVAGDIFSAEDRYGTWRTILTRSVSRTQIFLGKTLAALTFALVATAVLALSSLAAGTLLVGRQPLISLSGTLVPAGRSTVLVLASWASVLLPVLAFAGLAMLLSVATRSSAVGIGGPVVIGLVMQVGSLAEMPGPVRLLLLTTPFEAWHGLLTVQPFYRPLVYGGVISAAYLALFLALTALLIRRRDNTGSVR